MTKEKTKSIKDLTNQQKERSFNGFVRPVDFSTGSSVVVQVENLWKQYRLGTINHGTLVKDLQSWWARLCGKEDPNLQIDQHIKISGGSKGVAQDRFWALKDVSLDVKEGEVLGIIGKNGAGKSTLLKILSQVTSPTKGEIKIKGRIASLLEVGTGFHPELSGQENIFLNGAILGMNKLEITSKLDEIIAFAEIEKFIDTPVKRYSSGMYVRLAFAVAAHLEPEILIVDEVLAVGDAQFQKKCLGKMKDVSNEGRTVLFVSHNMSAMQRLCSRGILLNSGRIEATGKISEVVGNYLSFQQDNVEGASIDLSKFDAEDFSFSQISFLECKMRNSSGEVKNTFNYGEPIMFELMLESKGLYEDLAFHVGIDSNTGNRIFTSDSEEFGGLVNIHSGHTKISVFYSDFFLMPGQYSLSKLMIRQGRRTLLQLLGLIGSFEIISKAHIGKMPPCVGTGVISGQSKWLVDHCSVDHQ